MTKKDLVDKVAAGAAIKKTQAEKAIDSFVAAVKESLKKGDRVTVTGFGTFSVVERKARTGEIRGQEKRSRFRRRKLQNSLQQAQ